MEPMDLDIDGDPRRTRCFFLSQPSTPSYERDTSANSSYMDVDSPGLSTKEVKSSSSWEQIRNALGSIMLSGESNSKSRQESFTNNSGEMTLPSPKNKDAFGLSPSRMKMGNSCESSTAATFRMGNGIPEEEHIFSSSVHKWPIEARHSAFEMLANLPEGQSHSHKTVLSDTKDLVTPSESGDSYSSFGFSPSRLKKGHSWEPSGTAIREAAASKTAESGYSIPNEEIDFVSNVCQQQAKTEHSAFRRLANLPDGKSLSNGTIASCQKQRLWEQDLAKSGYDVENKRTRLKCSLVLLLISVTVIPYVAMNFMDLRERQCKIRRDFDKRILEMELEVHLYGQHIASKLVPKEMEAYFKKLGESDSPEQPGDTVNEALPICRPLVVSFHGWTGVGKNFVSQLVSSSFHHAKVSHYVIPLHFPHAALQHVYRQQVKEWIIGNFTSCMVNLIIMDEMDKVHPEVVKGISEAMHVLFQPCSSAAPVIFLLLSNSHAVDINQVFVRFFQISPTKTREALTHENFSHIFEEGSDLWYSKLVQDGLLHTFVPFLPLERDHVIHCIRRDLVLKRFSTDTQSINRILQELSFTAAGTMELSTTGCKRVADKVDFVMFDKQS